MERRTGQRDQTQWLQNEASPRRDLGHAEKEVNHLGLSTVPKKDAPKKVSGTYPGGCFLSLIKGYFGGGGFFKVFPFQRIRGAWSGGLVK